MKKIVLLLILISLNGIAADEKRECDIAGEGALLELAADSWAQEAMAGLTILERVTFINFFEEINKLAALYRSNSRGYDWYHSWEKIRSIEALALGTARLSALMQKEKEEFKNAFYQPGMKVKMFEAQLKKLYDHASTQRVNVPEFSFPTRENDPWTSLPSRYASTMQNIVWNHPYQVRLNIEDWHLDVDLIGPDGESLRSAIERYAAIFPPDIYMDKNWNPVLKLLDEILQKPASSAVNIDQGDRKRVHAASAPSVQTNTPEQAGSLVQPIVIQQERKREVAAGSLVTPVSPVLTPKPAISEQPPLSEPEKKRQATWTLQHTIAVSEIRGGKRQEAAKIIKARSLDLNVKGPEGKSLKEIIQSVEPKRGGALDELSALIK